MSVSQSAAQVVAAPVRLRMADAAAFVAAARPKLAGGGPVDLDLSALADFDSSALSALLALFREASARRQLLRCVNSPPNLRKLAALYGVDGILVGV